MQPCRSCASSPRTTYSGVARRRGARPRAIMQPEAPKDIGVSVGVASIERVYIVKIDHQAESFFIRRCPFNDLFSPVHPIVAVNDTAQQQFLLRGVPQIVMCLGALELFGRVKEG